jgi:hypothetical protein
MEHDVVHSSSVVSGKVEVENSLDPLVDFGAISDYCHRQSPLTRMDPPNKLQNNIGLAASAVPSGRLGKNMRSCLEQKATLFPPLDPAAGGVILHG